MRTENVSFDYPVLGISDDIKPTLEETGCANPDIRLDEEGNLFKVSVLLKLENADILSYIKNEYAEFSVEVSCHSTMYRNCFTSPVPEFSFLIEKKLLNGKLDFESFVIAKKDINNYKNEGLNPDYEGHVINLHKGDLLVAYRKCSIPLNLDLRNVRNMKSFMTIRKNNDENEHSVVYDLDDSKILILLPEEMMVEYNKKPLNASESNEENNKRKTILKASLYLEALTYALLNYKQYEKENDKNNYMWVNALTYRMNEPDIKDYCSEIFIDENNDESSEPETEEIFKLAHVMLNQPYLGMLKQIGTSNNLVERIILD